MEEWEVALENLCSELVSRRDFEPLLTRLLVENKSKWTQLTSLAKSSNVDLTRFGDVSSELHVVWLGHPTGDPGYAVIVFYDLDSKWTKGMDYNRERLLGMD